MNGAVKIEQPYWKRISKIDALMQRLIQDYHKGLPADEILRNTDKAYDKILWDYQAESGEDFNEPKTTES